MGAPGQRPTSGDAPRTTPRRTFSDLSASPRSKGAPPALGEGGHVVLLPCAASASSFDSRLSAALVHILFVPRTHLFASPLNVFPCNANFAQNPRHTCPQTRPAEPSTQITQGGPPAHTNSSLLALAEHAPQWRNLWPCARCFTLARAQALGIHCPKSIRRGPPKLLHSRPGPRQTIAFGRELRRSARRAAAEARQHVLHNSEPTCIRATPPNSGTRHPTRTMPTTLHRRPQRCYKSTRNVCVT